MTYLGLKYMQSDSVTCVCGARICHVLGIIAVNERRGTEVVNDVIRLRLCARWMAKHVQYVRFH
jgi:hypothetical protein